MFWYPNRQPACTWIRHSLLKCGKPACGCNDTFPSNLPAPLFHFSSQKTIISHDITTSQGCRTRIFICSRNGRAWVWRIQECTGRCGNPLSMGHHTARPRESAGKPPSQAAFFHNFILIAFRSSRRYDASTARGKWPSTRRGSDCICSGVKPTSMP